MDASVHAIFGIPELFISVLEYLPCLTLVEIERTCKHFRDVIEASPALKHSLFRDSSKEEVKLIEVQHNDSRVDCPRHPPYCPRSSLMTPVTLNPLLTSINYNALCTGGKLVYFKPPPSFDPFSKNPAWREMQLSHPPCRNVLFVAEARIPGLFPGILWLRNETGITFGDVVDEMFKHTTRKPVGRARPARIELTLEDVVDEMIRRTARDPAGRIRLSRTAKERGVRLCIGLRLDGCVEATRGYGTWYPIYSDRFRMLEERARYEARHGGATPP